MKIRKSRKTTEGNSLTVLPVKAQIIFALLFEFNGNVADRTPQDVLLKTFDILKTKKSWSEIGKDSLKDLRDYIKKFGLKDFTKE